MNQKLIQKPCQSDPVVLGQPDANIVTIPAHKTDTIPKKKMAGKPGKDPISQPEANTIIITHTMFNPKLRLESFFHLPTEVGYSQLRVMCRCSLQTTLGEGLINLGHLHMEEKLIILLVCFRPRQKTRRESPLLELRFVPRLSGEGCYYVNLPTSFLLLPPTDLNCKL
jgi:hypothetical protein